MSKTRVPTQKRSIEKRDKIIEKGFELMCKNGYYNTNTADIAKYAGVSTGIVYQYFNSKKEILLEGVKQYSNNIMFPIFMVIDEHEKLPSDIKVFFRKIIKMNKNYHSYVKKAHQELTALENLDNDIELILKNSEVTFSEKLYHLFRNNNINDNNLREKTHLIVNLIDNFAHEEIYHKHSNLNYEIMEDIVIDTIINILQG